MSDTKQQNANIRNVEYSEANVVNSDYAVSSKSFGRKSSSSSEESSSRDGQE